MISQNEFVFIKVLHKYCFKQLALIVADDHLFSQLFHINGFKNG